MGRLKLTVRRHKFNKDSFIWVYGSSTVLLENSVHEMVQDGGDRAMAHPDVDVVKPLDGVRCHQHGGGARSWGGALRVMLRFLNGEKVCREIRVGIYGQQTNDR